MNETYYVNKSHADLNSVSRSALFTICLKNGSQLTNSNSNKTKLVWMYQFQWGNWQQNYSSTCDNSCQKYIPNEFFWKKYLSNRDLWHYTVYNKREKIKIAIKQQKNIIKQFCCWLYFICEQVWCRSEPNSLPSLSEIFFQNGGNFKISNSILKTHLWTDMKEMQYVYGSCKDLGLILMIQWVRHLVFKMAAFLKFYI